jgi:hypothetical protein
MDLVPAAFRSNLVQTTINMTDVRFGVFMLTSVVLIVFVGNAVYVILPADGSPGRADWARRTTARPAQ